MNVNQYEETRDAFRVTFSDGKEGNVEIHIGNEKNDIPRMMYYLAQLHKSRIKYVKSYSQLCSSYAILISNTQLIDNEKQYHDFCLQDEDKIMFSDLLHVILIELSKVKEKRIDDMSAIEGWNYFFRNYENEEKQSIIELIKKKWSCDGREKNHTNITGTD